jgi:hypothetical protein
MTRTRWIAAVMTGLAGLAVLEVAWPVYPSTKSLCTVIEERNAILEPHVSPHRGAVLVLSGTLHGFPDEELSLECTCRGHSPVFIEIGPRPPWQAAAPEWERLRSGNFTRIDHRVGVHMIGRVVSESYGCFNAGMIIQPLIVRFDGPVQVVPRAPRRYAVAKGEKPQRAVRPVTGCALSASRDPRTAIREQRSAMRLLPSAL